MTQRSERMSRTGSNRRGTSRGRSAGRPAGRGVSSRNGRTAGRTAPRTTASRTTASRTTAGRTAGQRRGAGSRGGGDSTLNIALLIVTILVGLASWLIGTIFYELFLDQIPRIFVIGAVIVITSLVSSSTSLIPFSYIRLVYCSSHSLTVSPTATI